ncbi:MAG: hypothetical protein HOP29_08360 [Phycisphaerales bacterium]|nr:hypothetical protein [Phycisphaerales bacterium]
MRRTITRDARRLRTVSPLLVLGAAFLLPHLLPLATRADAIDDEYYARFKALTPDDVDGHLKLAVWCRDQQRWQLVARQCGEILKRRPTHEQAQLLLNLARAHLDGEQRNPGSTGAVPGAAPPAELTDDQVQRVRRAELNLAGDERVRLKIDRDALNAFYEQGKRDGILAMDRPAFFRMPRLEQARLILHHSPETYGNKIEIGSDPERMRDFIRDVQPVVLRGCATAECHGGSSAGRFRLLTGRSLSGNASYTNHFILQEFGVGTERVINRDLPERSLLLSYGLPRGRGGAEHPTEITRLFADESDREYRVVYDWISSLPITRPDYGFKRPDLTPTRAEAPPPDGGNNP